MKKAYGSDLQQFTADIRSAKLETVGELWSLAHSRNPSLGPDQFLTLLNSAVSQGFIKIRAPSIRSFSEYFKSWRYGFRGWLTLLSIVFSFIVVEASGVGLLGVALRWVMGSFLILFAPGFTLTWALFPSREKPAGWNRLALTIALSLFLVPATGLLLNFTYLGIHAESMAAVLVILSLIFLFVGMRRESSLLEDRSFRRPTK